MDLTSLSSPPFRLQVGKLPRCKRNQRAKADARWSSRSYSFRRSCGRRVEKNIKRRDLAVARDDEIHAGVLGRFAFRPRAPRQASRIVQNLGHTMRRINEVRMRRSEITGELVQCGMTDDRAGRHVYHTVFSVKFRNCGPSPSWITFTENFRKIAIEQPLDAAHICARGRRNAGLAGMLIHQKTPC